MDESRYTGDITEGERALRLFTDRHSAVRHFASYLNDDLPKPTILFFHGDGGNGKSLLLRYLEKCCCKRLSHDNWTYVSGLDEGEFIANLEAAADTEVVPVGRLDLSRPPRDPFEALLQLRRDLSGHGFHFPLFDFACVWYLKRTNQAVTKERLHSLFPEAALQLASAFAEISPVTDKLVAITRLADLYLGHWFTLYRFRRHLDQAVVDEITQWDPKSELLDELPRLFAEDLNTGLALPGVPQRIVLFFDTHEAIWGEDRDMPEARYFASDEWLRRLLIALDRGAGIVTVVAGRDAPRWHESGAAPFRIAKAEIDIQLVGHFTVRDALSYLERAGVPGDALRLYLCDYCRYAPDQIHPYFLGLCADLVLATSSKREAITPDDLPDHPDMAVRERRLIDRILKWVDRDIRKAVIALSVCRVFDRYIHRYVGPLLGFATYEADWEILTEFSFVQRGQRNGEPVYRIHALLQRFLRQEYEDEVHAADQAIESYYRERVAAGDEVGIAEAIYHANRLDPEWGAAEWCWVFESALRQSRFALIRALLDIRSELTPASALQWASVFANEADYLAITARYEEAKKGYTEAIAAYDEALGLDPSDPTIHNNKSTALVALGDLQVLLGDYAAAKISFEQAIAAYDEAVRLDPGDPTIHSNKGSALSRLGELHASLGDYAAAKISFEQAIAADDEALGLAPYYEQATAADDDAIYLAFEEWATHSNKGIAIASLGELHASLGDQAAAKICFEQAIAAYDEALRLAPGIFRIHSNKGNALWSLGNFHASLGDQAAAKISFEQAIAAHDEALRLAPDNPTGHDNKGTSLMALGHLQLSLGDQAAAKICFEQAIAAYDEALRLAPDNPRTQSNKGLVLESLDLLGTTP